MTQAEFGRFAGSYDQDLARSLAITGEKRGFYAQGRIDWTAQCVARIGCQVQRILDYGCGDGTNAPILAAKFKADHVSGRGCFEARLPWPVSLIMALGCRSCAQTSGHPTARWSSPSAMGSSITYHCASAMTAWLRFVARSVLEACSPFGKTTLGIPARVM